MSLARRADLDGYKDELNCPVSGQLCLDGVEGDHASGPISSR